MSLNGPFQPIKAAFAGEQARPTVILLYTTVLMVVCRYLIWPDALAQWLPESIEMFDDRGASVAIWSFLACFVLMGVVPAMIVKFAFRQSLADYGVGLGNRLRTVRSFLILAPLLLLIVYFGSSDPGLRAEYPLNPNIGQSKAMFGLHACCNLIYLMGYEFLVRGFVQIGLSDRIGRTNALLVQVLASVLFHLGKPWAETFGAFGVGILWGILAYRTRSLVSIILQHALVAIALDWFICFA